jgi:hypothetical protein
VSEEEAERERDRDRDLAERSVSGVQLSFSEAKGNTVLMQLNSCQLHHLV